MVETNNMGTGADKKNQHHHVAVLAFPYGTHAIPLLNLVRRLAIAAPNITFSFFSTSKSNSSIFGSSSKPNFLNRFFGPKSAFNIPSNVKAYDVEDGVPVGFTGHPMAEMEIFLKSMGGNFKQSIDTVLAGPDGKKISCVISDSFLSFAGDMAEELGVPWISLWTAGPCSLSTHYYTDLIRESIPLGPDGIAGREEEPIDFIPGLSVIRIKDLQEGIIFGNLESEFSQMLHRMGHMLPRATAVAMNAFEELDLPILDDLKSKFQNCLTVGPFTFTSPTPSNLDAHGCFPWLDSQKPTSVAYVSFGTVTTPPPQELVALAEGLEESGVPFLWSLKDQMKVHLPNGFLERTNARGLVVPWAPQERVLGHIAVGVFVTHCGWNSVLESITAGVPMICRPFFGDQRINSRMVSDVWGIGIRIKDGVFSKDGTMEGLDLVLSNEKMREKVGALRGIAKHAVGPKGSSSKNFNSLLEIVCRDKKEQDI
ncbi:UDP-glucuronosyl/UDP-glucosyltransferase [Macleaya cordata]|uniref:Glycosyltransferase n=1 Tax=Macleaya cordata TaxID=56857 RepID=A0A200RE20_MACCD|nr:UDP-glucuronosyl/UDP-glucosyltransferase [Macleaya cordata]